MNILQEVEECLMKARNDCVQYLCKFQISYCHELKKNNHSYKEILCEFEDMDQFCLSPTYRYISENGVVATGVPDIGKSGDDFFKESHFMPLLINDELNHLWNSVEEDEYYRLESNIDELIKLWIKDCWEDASIITGVEHPIHYCKHHWNYKTINLISGNERALL